MTKTLLLPAAGAYGSDRLHEKLRRHLDRERNSYEEYVAASRRSPKNIDWNTMPDGAKAVKGEIYYGLSGLAQFRDPDDLSFVRAVALWAVKYHLEQTADAAVDAFRDLPDIEVFLSLDAFLRNSCQAS